MSEMREWSKTDTTGTQVSAVPDGAPEGWQGENVNNWGRRQMSEVKKEYERPDWYYPLYDASPYGAPSLTKDSDTQFTVVGKDVVSLFTSFIGQRIHFRTTGDGDGGEASLVSAVLSVGDTIVTVEGGVVASSLEDIGFAKMPKELSPMVWGGVGTAAQRNAAFPTPRGNMLWWNTDTQRLNLASGGSWLTDLAMLLSTSPDPLAAAEQVIQAGLLSSTGRLAAPELQARVASGNPAPVRLFENSNKRAELRWDDPYVFLEIYDTGGTLESSWRFHDDGTFQFGVGASPTYASVSTRSVRDYKTSDTSTITTEEVIAQVTPNWSGPTRISAGLWDANVSSGTEVRIRAGALGTTADPELAEGSPDSWRSNSLTQSNDAVVLKSFFYDLTASHIISFTAARGIGVIIEAPFILLAEEIR